jgi:hypothetical protein
MDGSISSKAVQPPRPLRRLEKPAARLAVNGAVGDPDDAVGAGAPGSGTMQASRDPGMQSYAMMLAQDIRRRLPRELFGEDDPEAPPAPRSPAAALKLRAYVETAERSEDVSNTLLRLSREA